MESITFHTLWTVFMMAAFIVLVIWLLGGKQKKAMHDASQIPFLEDASESAEVKKDE